MAVMFNLILFTMSVYLVAARPGIRDMTEMMCSLSVSGCMGDIITADWTTPGGVAKVCLMQAPFISCVDNLPEHCAPYLEQFHLEDMLTSFEQLCQIIKIDHDYTE